MLKIYCNLLFKSFSKYIFRGFLCTAVLSLPMADLEAKNEIKNEVADLQTTQQSRKVSGVVLDTNNQPLVGATILQKGTSNGVITNLEGRFTIDLNGNAPVLEISYLGYVTETVKVGSRNTIKVILNEAAEQIDEVVVVGYGKSSVKRLTSAISTVKGDKLTNLPNTNLISSLEGRASGVFIQSAGGEPGALPTISIRGGGDPLYVIDGIPSSKAEFSVLSPSDIESFSILKDASASAMYGVRGANGVIVITTKHGQIGAPQVRVHVEHSINQPTKFPDFLDAPDYMTLLNQLAAQDGAILPFDQTRIDRTRSGYDPDLYPNVNWIDAITKDYAYTTKGNLEVSGGSDFLRYCIVASYFNESGILQQDKTLPVDNSTDNNQFNMRSNIDMNVTKTTLMRVNIGGFLNRFRKQRCSTDQAFSEAFETLPFVHPARYSDGSIPREMNRANPWRTATQGGYDFTTSSKIQTLFSVEQDLRQITPGLKAKGIFSFDRWNSSRRSRTSNTPTVHPATGRDAEGNLVYTSYDVGDESMGSETGTEYGNTNVYFEFNLNYSRKFGKNDIDALLLYNQQAYDDGSIQDYRKQGFAGRLSYTYDSRYVAEFNFGYNGSENFAKGHRFGFFPSVALGWLMSEEPWMEPLKNTFDKIKFRASMGQAGNDNIGGRRFAYLTTLKTDASGYTWGTTGQKNYDKGITEGEIGVTNLTWETATKSNLGLEVGLWNALDITVDVFREKRKNIFMQRRIIPTQTGFITNPWANYGKVTNGGMEVSINLHKQLNKDWFTSFYGNFTFAKNRVDEYDEAPSKIGTYRGQTGRSMNELWGLTAERLFTADDFESDGSLKFGIPKQEVGADKLYPGDIKYVDMNGDGKITEEDEGYIGGTEDPRIVYGFGGVIAYKNIDFNFFFQGTADAHRVIGNSTIFLPGSGTTVQGNAYSENLDDRWTDDNQDPYAFWPRLTYGPNKNNYRASTWWKKDMSFLRLKTVEIGYTFPKKWMEKIYSKGARVFVSGNNLLCFSPFKLWDPELGTNNGLKYPMNRSILFGIDINF